MTIAPEKPDRYLQAAIKAVSLMTGEDKETLLLDYETDGPRRDSIIEIRDCLASLPLLH